MEQRRTRRRLMGEINVVPYIDVMLVLLIIFMITAPLLAQGIKVDLPKAPAEPLTGAQLRDKQPLILSITPAGEFYLNIGDDKDKPVAPETLVARATAVLRRTPDTPVLVWADEKVSYGQVVTGMVLLQQAGAQKVGFVTEPPPAVRSRR
jgi:biopolymer transport protein TolR